MSLPSARPTGHGAAPVDGGEVICLHEYARLRSRVRERDQVDQATTMIDAERNVRAKGHGWRFGETGGDLPSV